MRFFIAGATGYLGGHFCEYLQQHGHEVTGFIRNKEKAGLLDKLQISYKIGDLTDKSTIIDALKEGYDVIINAAGYVDNRGSLEKFRKLNVETTKNLAEAMITTNHKRLIHISSVAAYGDFGLNLTETYTPKKHKWFKYGLTKLESEEILDSFDLDTTILRPPHIIGERDRTGFIPVLYHTIRRSNTWFEEGKTHVPIVYVKDVCSALLLVVEHNEAINETYNVSSPETISIREIIQIAHDKLGMRLPTKSYSYRYGMFLARLFEFLAIFGVKPAINRMGVMFASKDATFPGTKLEKLGWNSHSKSALEMVNEWVDWRKEFETKKH